MAGEQSADAIAARLAEILGRSYPFLTPLGRRYLKAFAAHTRPRQRAVLRFLAADEPLHRARKRHTLTLAQWATEPQRMSPVLAARGWPLPQIATAAELAEWLDLTPSELDWLADRKHLTISPAASPKLHHYHYRLLAKPHGAPRLIEIPKPRLKHLQRRILHEILDLIPAHDAVHGFRPGRSIATFAAPHVGQTLVLRMDLQDFFPSFSAARVQSFLRTLGYPESVADSLTALCTNIAPRSLWKAALLDPAAIRAAQELYGRSHLPQGAPTSPALANCLSYRMDRRLTGLAHAAGARYTRYADDLAFSGGPEFARRAERFSLHVAAVLEDQGLSPNHRKTRIMRQGVRQYLAGTVVNQRLNVPRPDYDLLKAILNNCIRHGPTTQNREAHPGFRHHLEGRISFVRMVNPARAAKLRALFDRIDWA